MTLSCDGCACESERRHAAITAAAVRLAEATDAHAHAMDPVVNRHDLPCDPTAWAASRVTVRECAAALAAYRKEKA